MSCKVTVPESYTGDIMGDFNKRRARVMGVEPIEGTDQCVIEAEAPQANMMNYPIDLRSMTQGRGNFDMEFVRYEQVPSDVQNQIIQKAKEEA